MGSAEQTLRVGIIGAGGIVRTRHAPGLLALPGVAIAAVSNASLASAHAFCAGFCPGAKVFEEWRELAASPDLDAVFIGAAPFLHEAATLAALRSGKHTFCQARMSTDLASAMRMLEAAEEHPSLVTMLCPPPHGLRVDACVRDLLHRGEVGDVRKVCVRSLSGAFLDPAAPAHWRQRTEISGKNILTLGIYTEVLQRWFGRFEVAAVSGEVHVPERAGYRICIPDSLTVMGRFTTGIPVLLELSGCHPGVAVEQIEIVGSRGVLRVDGSTDDLVLENKEGCSAYAVPAGLDRPWQVEADFVHAIRNPGNPRPRPDFRDGVAYMEVVENVWSLLR
jgi:predicted dehydrogenase